MVYAVLVTVALLYIYPFVPQIGRSSRTDGDATTNPLNPFPTSATLRAYERLADLDFAIGS